VINNDQIRNIQFFRKILLLQEKISGGPLSKNFTNDPWFTDRKELLKGSLASSKTNIFDRNDSDWPWWVSFTFTSKCLLVQHFFFPSDSMLQLLTGASIFTEAK